MTPSCLAAPTSPVEDDPRWRAVLARDSAADGAFVYAVRGTGIYCRPSCPSRRPKPAGVEFHATPAAAEAAGFRACLRCDPKGVSPNQTMAQAVARACRSIDSALAAGESPPVLADLAAAEGFSPTHFHRRFTALAGLTPRAYAAAARARRVRAALAAKEGDVTSAIYEAGYGSSGRFYENAEAALGMKPGVYKRGAPQERIRFALAQCALGALLAARSEKGLCAIALGDDPEALIRELQDRFPKAELIGGDAEFESQLAQVAGFVEAPRLGLDLPLDLRGTAFQERVWRALQAIPPGETASYAEIAARIGQPKSARAVALACAANELAVAVPCHRVVRSDGALSGYRWGVARKSELLAREAGG